jgi:uncharacterized membrane protein YfcA
LLAIGGILIGNKLSSMISQVKLRKMFGWFVLVMGCWILLKEVVL